MTVRGVISIDVALVQDRRTVISEVHVNASDAADMLARISKQTGVVIRGADPYVIVEKPLDYGAIGLPRPNPDDPRLALMRPFPKFVEDAVYLLGVIIDPCVLRGGMEDDHLVVSSIEAHRLLESWTVMEMVGLMEALNQTVHYHGFEGTITVEIPVRLSVLLEMMARGELVIDHGSHLRVRQEGDPWKDHDLDRDIARQP